MIPDMVGSNSRTKGNFGQGISNVEVIRKIQYTTSYGSGQNSIVTFCLQESTVDGVFGYLNAKENDRDTIYITSTLLRTDHSIPCWTKRV